MLLSKPLSKPLTNEFNQAWLNGQQSLGLSEESVSLFDRGLLYGDGFFTTILAHHQSVYNWPAHWHRLQFSAERLGFAPLHQTQIWHAVSQALHSASAQTAQATWVIKVLITRGQGQPGYQMPAVAKPNVVVYISPAPVVCDTGLHLPHNAPIRVVMSSIEASVQAQLAGVKHLNRLENVLARSQLSTLNADEALMQNALGFVVCSTQANLFMLKDGVLNTPKLNQSGVQGTTRWQLTRLLPTLGWHVREVDLTLDDLTNADGLFLANAVRGIMPIQQLNQQHFAVDQVAVFHQAWSDWQVQHAQSIAY
jgi:4-amino-4-deoxychorismate lyase